MASCYLPRNWGYGHAEPRQHWRCRHSRPVHSWRLFYFHFHWQQWRLHSSRVSIATALFSPMRPEPQNAHEISSFIDRPPHIHLVHFQIETTFSLTRVNNASFHLRFLPCRTRIRLLDPGLLAGRRGCETPGRTPKVALGEPAETPRAEEDEAITAARLFADIRPRDQSSKSKVRSSAQRKIRKNGAELVILSGYLRG